MINGILKQGSVVLKDMNVHLALRYIHCVSAVNRFRFDLDYTEFVC